MTNIRKCPLCGGDVLGKTCFSCGFEFPDEKTMRDKHDFEPDDIVLQPSAEDILPPPRYFDVDYKAADYAAPNIKVAPHQQNAYTPPPRAYAPPPQNTYQNSSFDDFCQRYSEMSLGQKFKKYWWAVVVGLLVSGIFPIIAAIAVKLFGKSDRKNALIGDLILLGILSIFIFS
ncbi:MAG: hypothetical protein LBM87_00400 [Ruminococcus sp.]|nr:hypothetical protein [Ruminococcus sp.]